MWIMGSGPLTDALAAGSVITIDIDPALHAMAKETIVDVNHARAILGDSPKVLRDLRREERRAAGSKRLRCPVCNGKGSVANG